MDIKWEVCQDRCHQVEIHTWANHKVECLKEVCQANSNKCHQVNIHNNLVNTIHNNSNILITSIMIQTSHLNDTIELYNIFFNKIIFSFSFISKYEY